MWFLPFLTLSFCAFNSGFSAPTESTSSTVKCFDCHYDPGALKQRDDGSWVAAGSGGFPRCALMNSDDSDFLNKYGCTKGKCFIRRDRNGQVFRGCADPWNLPWGVDTETNCKQQQDKSLWWFCEGDLCNDGKIDDNERCDNLPKRKNKERSEDNEPEQVRVYEQTEQQVYEPTYYDGKTEENYSAPSASISVTVYNGEDTSTQAQAQAPPVSAYEEKTSPSLPKETVYGNEYSEINTLYDMYLSKFPNDQGSQPYYHEDDKDVADFADIQEGSDVYSEESGRNNDDVYYSRTLGTYVNYGEGPVGYYTDSELSYNADRNFKTYDYVLPDDYGRPTEFNTVEELPISAVDVQYTNLNEVEENEPAVSDGFYMEVEEAGGEDTIYEEGLPIDGAGFHDENGVFHSYDVPTLSMDQPMIETNDDGMVAEKMDEAVPTHYPIPYGWHPYFYPWLHAYYANGHNSVPQATKDSKTVAWNGKADELGDEAPKSEGSAALSSYSKTPKKSHYEPPKKSRPQPKKSHPEPPKKSHYEPLKKSHLPTKKSHPEPPRKSQPPPKKSHYEPPKKSQLPPKKSHPEPPKKSHYEPPKKSHLPTKKSHPEPPRKSQPPPKKSHYEPPRKSLPSPKKSQPEPPKKSHPEPLKKSHPTPKKSHYESSKKSHPPPKKTYQPAPKKSHEPAQKKSYEPAQKKSYEPSPKKSHEPAPKKSYVSPKKSQSDSGSSDKEFHSEDKQARNENATYTLGGNLHVRGMTLIPVDESKSGVNDYVEVGHDNVDYGRNADDNMMYYEYEYEMEPTKEEDKGVGSADLDDPNALTDDTAYYYEYSHKAYTPSENVQNLCSSTCGLYPHPDNFAKFVQCGPGVHFGASCDCCHPYEHSCPDGTSFDNYIGVCSQTSSNTVVDHATYKSIDLDY